MKDGKHVILLVDDDADFLDSVKIVLDSAGYEVETAGSAEQGLERFRAAQPDLVIVDLMMEEVDAGIGFVRELRLSGDKVPVYMLSSVGEQLHMSIDHSALGLSGVFQKPVDPANLLRTIESRLAKEG